jgi:hypothetical protein
MAFDFTYFATHQAKTEIRALRFARRRPRDELEIPWGRAPESRSSARAGRRRRACSRAPAHRGSTAPPSTRRFAFLAKIFCASASTRGAITTSANCGAERFGRARVERTVEREDAAEGRHRVGLERLRVRFSERIGDRGPHGLACFTITQAGSVKLFTHSHAASASAMLL